MPSTGYPTSLPVNAKVINTIYPVSLNPNFDITWSFEYNLSGIDNTSQGGFTSFLINSDYNYILSGGNVGIDLGYSGLSGLSSYSTNISGGILSGILGVGFDTTGLFALSTAIDGNTIRDGVSIENIVPNSIVIRGSSPNYPILFTTPCPFNILNNAGEYVSIRCRLGNLSKTLYVDYKLADDANYTNIVTLNVNLSVNDATVYTPGISFTSPISSDDTSKVCTLKIKNLHLEGREDKPQITETFDTIITKELFTLLTEVSTTCISSIQANFDFSSTLGNLNDSAFAIQDWWGGKVLLVRWNENINTFNFEYEISNKLNSLLNYPADSIPTNPTLQVITVSPTPSTLTELLTGLQDIIHSYTTIDSTTGSQGLTAIQSSYPDVSDDTSLVPYVTSTGSIGLNTVSYNFGVTPVWFEETTGTDYFFLNL